MCAFVCVCPQAINNYSHNMNQLNKFIAFQFIYDICYHCGCGLVIKFLPKKNTNDVIAVHLTVAKRCFGSFTLL